MNVRGCAKRTGAPGALRSAAAASDAAVDADATTDATTDTPIDGGDDLVSAWG